MVRVPFRAGNSSSAVSRYSCPYWRGEKDVNKDDVDVALYLVIIASAVALFLVLVMSWVMS